MTNLKPWSMARVITASSAGTAFEWYDFFVFGALASVVGKVFFSGLDGTAGLIAALGLFAAGFAFRPLGAILFGAMGDRIGRKATFLITVSLMGGATFAIGLLPTYATAGVVAPALLILLRILQGLALGGEYGGAAIYVAEHAEDHRRGWSTAWIQSSAAAGLMAALLAILAVRATVGEDASLAWGWRVPFLASIILLAISVWMRFKLSESPAYQKLKEDGQVTSTPLREAFAEKDSLKQVGTAFFGFMSAQGAVWYFTYFYAQTFLERMLGMPGAAVNMIMVVMTLLSVPLYIFFGWLSDRVGRKPVMMGGMLLALVAYFPGFHGIADAANPRLISAQAASPVVIETDPASCSVQFDLLGRAKYSTACDIASRYLTNRGIGYERVASTDGLTQVRVGDAAIKVENVSDPELLANAQASLAATVGPALEAAGYPQKAALDEVNWWALYAWMTVFVIAASALYGPMAAALVEMFPTRIRYTAMSLPYHIGTGWIGGFLPVTSVAIVAMTGDIYSALWYPVFFTALSLVCAYFLMKETSGEPLH
jgi:MFS family permease